MTTTRPTIYGIQYLRGIAALMVVLHHARHYFDESAWPVWTAVGARGVDIFFVISGFVMAYTTQSMRDMSRPRFEENIYRAVTFFAKRLVRIVPLYWIAIAWTARHELRHGTADLSVWLDFLFIPHFSSAQRGHIYPVLIPGWTINYEMFFYTVFACCMLFGSRNLIATMALILGLCVMGQLFSFESAPAQFYTSVVLMEFVLGIVVFMIVSASTETAESTRQLVYVPGLLISAVAIVLAQNTVVIGLSAAVIVLCTVSIFRFARGHLGLLKLLGDASYSIYLFHLATFPYSRGLIGYMGLDVLPDLVRVPVILMIQIIFAVVAGIAIHRWIERPLLRMGHNLIDRFDVTVSGRKSTRTPQ